ncbi:MAG TPA: anthranilate phosphoribosyltransferase [Armatimonadota bacterium]|nr:anthranilate phosphoribosyltransferase [Armatimonadota bacterium]
MIKDAIRAVVEGSFLTEDEAAAAMNEIMSGEATPAQIACLITALRMRGETVDEITGFVRVMREKSVKVTSSRMPLIDTCGTGGDRLKTFNISTTAAFVVAGAGVAVAKHGNRAASSKCGSADVLDALGVKFAMPAEDVGKCIDECSIGFLFAPALHPAMKHAVGPRKEIGIRTVFNILGPMTNPANAKYQVIGVFLPEFCELMAKVLVRLGTERAMVVHGMDGIDECSTFGPTLVAEISSGEVAISHKNPADFGCNISSVDELAAGELPEENAEMLLSVLKGEKGPRREIVLANAGAAFYVVGKARDLKEGAAMAAESIDSGAALKALENLKKFTEEYQQVDS